MLRGITVVCAVIAVLMGTISCKTSNEEILETLKENPPETVERVGDLFMDLEHGVSHYTEAVNALESRAVFVIFQEDGVDSLVYLLERLSPFYGGDIFRRWSLGVKEITLAEGSRVIQYLDSLYPCREEDRAALRAMIKRGPSLSLKDAIALAKKSPSFSVRSCIIRVSLDFVEIRNYDDCLVQAKAFSELGAISSYSRRKGERRLVKAAKRFYGAPDFNIVKTKRFVGYLEDEKEANSFLLYVAKGEFSRESYISILSMLRDEKSSRRKVESLIIRKIVWSTMGPAKFRGISQLLSEEGRLEFNVEFNAFQLGRMIEEKKVPTSR